MDMWEFFAKHLPARLPTTYRFVTKHKLQSKYKFFVTQAVLIPFLVAATSFL